MTATETWPTKADDLMDTLDSSIADFYARVIKSVYSTAASRLDALPSSGASLENAGLATRNKKPSKKRSLYCLKGILDFIECS